jgi:hypothetical protein
VPRTAGGLVPRKSVATPSAPKNVKGTAHTQTLREGGVRAGTGALAAVAAEVATIVAVVVRSFNGSAAAAR